MASSDEASMSEERLKCWREPTQVPKAWNVSYPKIVAPKPTVAKVPLRLAAAEISGPVACPSLEVAQAQQAGELVRGEVAVGRQVCLYGCALDDPLLQEGAIE